MRLVEFSVTNYRSITTASRIAIGNYTVLVGKNNEGKSNLLTALNVSMLLLMAHAESKGLSPFARRESGYNWDRDFPVQLRSRRTGLESIFKLNFRLGGDELQQFHDEVKINGNDDIPITIKLGKDNHPIILVPKKGTSSYNTKSKQVTNFISERIKFNYIPAIRTESMATRVLDDVFSSSLSSLREDEEYLVAEKKVYDLQKAILDEMSKKLLKPLQVFLPKLTSIEMEPSRTSLIPSYYQNNVSVYLNDGISTNLKYKGDGIKSLFAMAILKDLRVSSGASVIAIEEPESHLHSGAIHELADILTKMSENSQVIISTHNPLFVRQNNISSNVIVDNGTARSAKKIAEIREVLGIWASDNLRNALYVLIVEGESDKVILSKILPCMSEKIKNALSSNQLVIKSLDGAGNLQHDLADLKTQMCKYVVLLDNDKSGTSAASKAIEKNLIRDSDIRYTICNGSPESEIEDCINPTVYIQCIKDQFNVDLRFSAFKCNKKWSDRVKDCFNAYGAQWDEKTEAGVKTCVANCIPEIPSKTKLEEVLIPNKSTFLQGLVLAIEGMFLKT